MLRAEQSSAEGRCTLPRHRMAAYVSPSEGLASLSSDEVSNNRPAATTGRSAWSSVAVKALEDQCQMTLLQSQSQQRH